MNKQFITKRQNAKHILPLIIMLFHDLEQKSKYSKYSTLFQFFIQT